MSFFSIKCLYVPCSVITYCAHVHQFFSFEDAVTDNDLPLSPPNIALSYEISSVDVKN